MKKNSIRALRARLFAEALEGRQLLSSVVTSGVLQINGTGNADTYFINRNGSSLIVTENGGATKTYDYASITSINAILAGGNDTLTIANTVIKPSYISGGAGDDAIIGGGGDDVIDPGIGNDYVEGRDGTDTLSYASRSEAITGSLRVTLGAYIRGVPRTFALNGAAGAVGETDISLSCEALLGGSGNDTLSSGGRWNPNIDDNEQSPTNIPDLRIDGNGGDDLIQAGNVVSGALATSDAFPRVRGYGGEGNDDFYMAGSSHAATTLYGGAGNDHFSNGTDDSAIIDAGSGYDQFSISGGGNYYSTFTIPLGLEEVYSDGTVIGNDQDNVIRGGSYVDGRGGNDTLRGSGTILGGDGNDTITAVRALYVDGGIGDDTFYVGGSQSENSAAAILYTTVLGGDGVDNLFVKYDLSQEGVRRINYDGGPGYNTFILDDRDSPEGYAYRIDDGTVTRSRIANGGDTSLDDRIVLSRTYNHIVMGGAETYYGGPITAAINNRFDVYGIPNGTTLRVDGGYGDDVFNIHQTGAVGSINIRSDDGNDHLLIGSEGGQARVGLEQSENFADITIGSHAVLHVGSYEREEKNALRTNTLNIAPGGQLNLFTNPLVIDYAGSDVASYIASIETLIRSGRGPQATWDGPGIVSQVASFLYPILTLGVTLRSKLAGTFPELIGDDGELVYDPSVIIRSTLVGDFNLDRKVDFDDLVILAQNYNQTGRTYAQGNGDYSANGAVNFDDLILVAQNYNRSIPTAAATTATVASTKKKDPVVRDILG